MMTKSKLRYLNMPNKTQQDWVDQLTHSPYLDSQLDYYNTGELVTLLESRVANILGKPSALFFSKGMVAQFCALKVTENRIGNNNVALHPLSHIAYDEANSYQNLLILNGLLAGNDKPMSLEDLTSLNVKPGTVSIELPLRRAGFRLPEWNELCAISEWCQENEIHLHMDGARLWESTHFYQRNEAEISKLFDSVYVSLYKGIGALGGAVLAGSEDFIDQCKIWRTRFGGDSYTLFPFLVTALDGLDSQLRQIPEYVLRAKEIARSLNSFSQLEIPEPHTNGFFVFLSGDKKALNQKADELTLSRGIKLFNSVNEFPNSERLMIEIQVGANHHSISDDEIHNYFDRLLNEVSETSSGGTKL